MNAVELLHRLRSTGVDLAAVGGRLKVSTARGALTDKMKEEIKVHKAALLTILEQPERTSLGKPVGVLHERRTLSSFQRQLWINHRLDPASTAYNFVTTWPSFESLSVKQMTQAIRDVVRNHEILRTTFLSDETEPFGQLLPVEAVPIEVRDLRALSYQEMDEIIDADRVKSVHTPFNLGMEAPVRWILYRIGDTRVATVVAVHHIAMDEWSFTLLRSEIAAACQLISENAPPRGPRSLQYHDYAEWQRREYVSSEIAAELNWWTGHLAGIPQLCTFQADQPPGIAPSGATYNFSLSAELTAGIRSLARRSGVTVYMALLAACAVVLRVHAGQDAITLGSPMGVRERAEFETTIGPFVNLLVLRLELSDDPTFADLLARARATMLDAHDHRQVPFDMLIERLNPARVFDRSPLFQVAVVLHNASDEPGSAIYSGGAIHDLTWFAREVEGRLVCALEYRSDLYTAEAVRRIALQLETVLRAAVDGHGGRIGTISLLSAAERRQVVEATNATACEVDTATFVEQFERQVAATPTACAVQFEGRKLTYGDLNRRSNELARHLRSQGIGPGRLIGLCIGRSLDMVTGLLGNSKGGRDLCADRSRFRAGSGQFHAERQRHHCSRGRQPSDVSPCPDLQPADHRSGSAADRPRGDRRIQSPA